MATHSSILAWRMTEEPGGLQSTVHGVAVGHDGSDLTCTQ